MDLDQEIKKLNYALNSYKCNHHADYEEDTNTGKVTFLLLDSGELPIITKEVSYGDNFEKEVTDFKKQAIKFCSHVKA
tara:strand:- start:11002 stop:11235 length:234 start_codon:yes stop_codon:yes gene_type:complete